MKILFWAILAGVAWGGSPNVKPFPGAAVTVGNVTLAERCQDDDIQLWISSGPTLVYQTFVAPKGTFEFHLNPGRYTVAATGNRGCFAEKSLLLTPGDVKKLDLGLEPTLRKGREPAWINDCPYCNQAQAGAYYTPPPWWSGYAALSYPNNYSYPGPWSGTGIVGSYYPGFSGGGFMGGSGFMAKPNVYFFGKPGTRVTMKVVSGDHSNLLSAVPLHGSKGWTATLEEGGKVASGGATYPYLFYDGRVDITKLQNKRGFCMESSELLPRLEKELRASGFRDNELADFNEYWSMRIPKLPGGYCVFPQEDAELKQVAALEITPRPRKLVRVVFMVVPREAFKTTARFNAEPTETWVAHPDTRVPASAGEGLDEVHEWGLGFFEANSAH